MRKIRKGDSVVVTAGREKGRTGTVVGVQGGIVQKEAPLHASNVALLNPATKKADRVGVRTLKDGRKVRFFKSNGELVDA